MAVNFHSASEHLARLHDFDRLGLWESIVLILIHVFEVRGDVAVETGLIPGFRRMIGLFNAPHRATCLGTHRSLTDERD